jgi:hypothetical protein
MYVNDPLTELIERVLWPKIDDAIAAKKVARQGAYFEFFRAAFAITFKSHLTRMAQTTFMPDTPEEYFLDAVIYVVLGFLILRRSRAAAIIALIVYLAEIALSIFMGRRPGYAAPFHAMYALFFVNSIRGIYAYRRFTLEPAVSRVITAN